jgi:hypothetical protein
VKTLLNILKSNGEEAVKLYKQTLVDNDRVATGDTKESIRYEAKEEGTKGKLTIYALDHIRDLETGQTPEEISANPPMLQQIERWVIARRVNRAASAIIRGLILNGFEGTPGLITDVDKIVEINVLDDIKKNIKKDILSELRLS